MYSAGGITPMAAFSKAQVTSERNGEEIVTSLKQMFTWTLHGNGKTLKPGEIVEPKERLTWPRTIGIGAQHVVAMFGATFLVPILTGFDPSTTLFFTAFSTALFLLINKNLLPSYLGSSFGFIAPIAAVASSGKGIAVASFGILCTGLLLAIIGFVVQWAGAIWIDRIMPPVVNGAIVAIIGFNLAPNVWTNFKAAPDTALVTLAAVLLIAVLFKGLIGRLNILLGVLVGYAYACIRGQVDFQAIEQAAWVGFPKFHLPQADFTILPMFLPVVLVLIAENVGHVKSVAQMTGHNYDDQIGTALIADGLGTTVAGIGGGSGTTTYGENIGVMAATKVYSTAAYWCAAGFAFLLSLCPKFGSGGQFDPGRRTRRRHLPALRHDRHDRRADLGGQQGRLRQTDQHHDGLGRHDRRHRELRVQCERHPVQRHRHRLHHRARALPWHEGHRPRHRHHRQGGAGAHTTGTQVREPRRTNRSDALTR
jgi:uracil-xanthine permease